MTATEAIRVLQSLQNELQRDIITNHVPYERYLTLVGEHRGLERGIAAIKKIGQDEMVEHDE